MSASPQPTIPAGLLHHVHRPMPRLPRVTRTLAWFQIALFVPASLLTMLLAVATLLVGGTSLFVVPFQLLLALFMLFPVGLWVAVMRLNGRRLRRVLAAPADGLLLAPQHTVSVSVDLSGSPVQVWPRVLAGLDLVDPEAPWELDGATWSVAALPWSKVMPFDLVDRVVTVQVQSLAERGTRVVVASIHLYVSPLAQVVPGQHRDVQTVLAAVTQTAPSGPPEMTPYMA